MKATTHDTTQAHVVDAIVALIHTLRALHTDATPWLDLDLTMAQLKALMVVVQTGGVASRGLADRLSISAPAVTPLVDRLVDQKLVRREDDPSDRRVVLIRPTARAMSLYEKLMETSRTIVAPVVNELPAAEISGIEHVLAQLLGASRQVLARAQKTPHSNSNGVPAPR